MKTQCDFKCDLCEDKIPNRTAFNRHIKLHKNIEPEPTSNNNDSKQSNKTILNSETAKKNLVLESLVASLNEEISKLKSQS